MNEIEVGDSKQKMTRAVAPLTYNVVRPFVTVGLMMVILTVMHWKISFVMVMILPYGI